MEKAQKLINVQVLTRLCRCFLKQKLIRFAAQLFGRSKYKTGFYDIQSFLLLSCHARLSNIFLSFLPLSFLDDQILKFLLFLLIPDETSQITNKILELVFGCIGVAKIFKMLANILWRKVQAHFRFRPDLFSLSTLFDY